MRTTGSNCGSGSLPPAVLVDFDDTSAEQNVAELLLERFGGSTWKANVRERLQSRELTLKEYQEIVFRDIRADRAAMQAYVKQNATLRPFFGELWSYCCSHGFPMAIVSLGLDFYIEALLDKEGFAEVPVFAVNTDFTPEGISFEYRHARPGQEKLGISKGLVVDRYREQGHCVFYAGDGMSDFEAADRADVLFAHSRLADGMCQARHTLPSVYRLRGHAVGGKGPHFQWSLGPGSTSARVNHEQGQAGRD